MNVAELSTAVEKVATWNPKRNASGYFTYVDLSSIDQQLKAVTEPSTINASDAPSRARQLINAGDVLVSTVRPNLNAVAFVPPGLGGATASTGFCVLRPRSGRLDGRYLFHWVRSPRFVGEMVSLATGANYPAVSDKIVKGSSIPLPPIEEQRRIAAVLDTADALRAKRRQALFKLDTLTRAIFIEMFGDPLVKGMQGRELTISTRLGALAKVRTGKLDANAASDLGRFPFFTCAATPLRIDTAAFDTKAVLVAGNGDLNVKYYEGRFNAYQRTYVIDSLDEEVADARFLHGFLQIYVARLRELAIGGVIKYIKLGNLTEAEVQLPSIEAQRTYKSGILRLVNSRSEMKISLDRLEILFASLQHRAFKGEL